MPSERRVLWVLWGVASLFVLAVLLTAASLLQSQQAEARAQGEARLTRFMAGAEAAINRSFMGIDMLLAGLGEPLAELESADPADARQQRSRLLAQVVRQNLQLRDVVLLAQDGSVLAAGQDSSLRQAPTLPAGFLARVLAPGVPVLAISTPIVNPATAEAALYFARPLAIGAASTVLLAEVPVSLVAGIAAQSVGMAFGLRGFMIQGIMVGENHKKPLLFILNALVNFRDGFSQIVFMGQTGLSNLFLKRRFHGFQ